MSPRASRGWEPLEVGKAQDPGQPVGMAGVFYATGGRRHHYRYRTPQPAVECLAFANRLYNGFALRFVDGSMHLTFKRNDRAAVRDWRHFQAIKNEVAGPEREAVELFPAESNLFDAANEYHLWIAPEGHGIEMGLEGAAEVADSGSTHDHALYRQTGQSGYAQRSWEPGIPTGLGREGAS